LEARASTLSSAPGRRLGAALPDEALVVVRAGAVAVIDVTPGGRPIASTVLEPGDLVSTLREAVTIAFQGLERDGRLERRGPRIWIVRTESSHRISAPQETAHGVEIQGP
jgi:hypothetical protein